MNFFQNQQGLQRRSRLVGQFQKGETGVSEISNLPGSPVALSVSDQSKG
jgi:hypothetical protein